MCSDNQDGKDPIGSDLVREDPSFADIVVHFVNSLSERLTELEEAIRTADLDALRIAAHQLKGSGGGYGYPTLYEQAAKLELQAQEGALEECVKSFEQLKKICQRVVVSADGPS
jgi:HPt (histidine-containing phosphotransfer) domain-containing protein